MHLYYIIRQIDTGWKQLTQKHNQATFTHSLYSQHLFGRLLQRPIHLRTRIYIRRAPSITHGEQRVQNVERCAWKVWWERFQNVILFSWATKINSMLYNIIVFVSQWEESLGGAQQSKLSRNKELCICLACPQVLWTTFKPILYVDITFPRN